MGEYLETYLGEFNLFVAFLDKVNECDIKNISSDFSSPLDFKKYILENLKETGKFNEISNSHLVYMTEVPELLVMLTGDSKYSTAVQKNLTTTGFNWLAPTYKNLTSEQFNAIFSDQIIKNGVEDLNLNYFTNLLKMFDESGEYKWMGCSTFTDKILDLSVDDFYDIPTKYIKNALENLSNNGDDTIALEFMKKLQDKFMTNEILSSNPKNFDKVISMFPIISSNEGVQKLKDSFVLMKRDFDTKIKDSIVKNSEIEIPNNLIYTDVESDKFYDLIYEVNGVEHRIELPANYGSYNLKSIIDENNLTDSAINGELKIKMLEYNHDKNKFILDELHGVRPGLNQIKILVDGKEQNLVLKCYGKTCSLKDSLGENVKNIEVISCQPIKSFNLEVDVSEVGKTYIFEYEIDGVMRSKYITAQGAHWSNGNKNVLDIDSLVLGNQLLDITNYRISKIDWDNFKHEKIDFVKSENVDIFTGEKYGGNQQDVTDIMKNFIENKCTTSIEYKKGELLMSLARKRFPKNYSTSGCSYMAFSNAFLTYMGRIDNYEAIFKDKFGFDLFLKDGNQTSYNVEALAFDIYLDYVSKKGDLSFLMNENGVSSGKFYEVYEEYFKTKGIDIDIHSESGESYKSIILNSEDEFLIMGSSMFDLEALEDNFNISNLDGATTNSQLDGKLVKGIGGHAMMVTEFDEDNNIIVSSWGKKYKYLPNSVKEYKNSGQDSYFTLHTVKFSFSE